MINSLLNNLSTALGRVFVIAIVPLLVFLLLHGLMINAVFPAASRWIALNLVPEIKDNSLVTFAALLAIITLAYVWSTLSVSFREALEGKPLGSFSTFLGSRYASRLHKALEERDRAGNELRKLATSAPQWQGALRAARVAAQTLQQCTYVRTPLLASLIELRSADRDINAAALDREVATMIEVMRTSSADFLGNPASTALDTDLTTLRLLVEYSRQRWSARLASALKRVEFDFAGQNLSATKMGNIAQSVSNYAETRYGIRLEVFWSRLQEAIGKNDRFNEQLQEANTRVDFIVSFIWHTGLFTLAWVGILPFYGHSQAMFLTVAVGGVVACAIWYLIALQAYRALASLMRAGIDLHRHAVLKGMGLAAPRSLTHERELWNILEQHVAYGSRNDFALKVDGA
jgi:hypothetical protein